MLLQELKKYLLLLKKKQQAQNGEICAKLHVNKPRHNT